MLRADTVVSKGDWAGDPIDTVSLDFDSRHRRRITMTGTNGLKFLMDLPRPVALAAGDALQLEDGTYVAVVAAPEALLEISAPTPFIMTRIAWHLGNRHLPTEIAEDRLFIRYDHVIEAMLAGLGALTARVDRPFQPEGGAYGQGRVMGHDHGHDHSHAHDHSHEHSHDHGHHHHHHD